jgi:hypothetical protein
LTFDSGQGQLVLLQGVYSLTFDLMTQDKVNWFYDKVTV